MDESQSANLSASSSVGRRHAPSNGRGGGGGFFCFRVLAAIWALNCLQATAQRPQKIAVNFSTRSGAAWPVFIAKEGGYYQKFGLDSDLVFAGHPAGIAMVVSGQAQASLYNLESIMQATVRDGSLVIVGSSVNRVVFALMSRPEIASVKDVKGKTVAVSQIGDPPYQFASAYLKKFGLGPRDVQWVAVGSDANSRAAALRAGRVDATLLTPPAYFRLEEAGYRNLGNLADYDDLFGSAVYVFSRHTISANPTLPELLIKAHAEATKRFYDDKPFAVKAYRVYDNQTQADVERLYDIYAKGNLLERVPFVPVGALQGVIEHQIDAQIAAQMKSFDFRRVVNNSIISRLLGEGYFEGLFGPSIKSEQDQKAGLAYK